MDVILPFLRDIHLNDTLEWYLAHTEEYSKAFNRNAQYIELLIEQIGKFDPSIKELQIDDCSFSLINDRKLKISERRYNDFFSGSFTREGKYSGYASYYYQISSEPSSSGGSFLAVGIYNPNKELMDYLRREFTTRGEHIVSLIRKSKFELYTRNVMKRLPSEFVDSDYRFHTYMRQRDLILIKRLDISWFRQDNWIAATAAEFQRCMPFVEFINSIVDRYRNEVPLPVGHALRPIKRSTRDER